ncbi:uncharacterized protein LOC113674039 [Pocillopora damicornis]|uniref:uncharacterized protein LOC113674039 n=1 Tax=Pocillopora damicornis TaxID=46731 RepID=UPI000F552212|nr:uncharacterized protein LOC113674039 [Pocillopora damicornis]
MAEMNHHPESVKSQLGHLSVEKLARTVVISNIPREITKDEIHIYFQKSKHGGGEVDDIWIVKDEEAVIVFENPEVADSVLKRSHVLGGKKVDLRPYNTQVFSRVAAFVSFGTMSPRKSESLLEMMKEKVDVSWQSKGHNGFVLLGSINQLEFAHRYLQEFFLRRPYLLFKEERMVQGEDTVKARQNSPENFEQAKKDSQKIVEECTFEVEPKFMKLFKRVHKEKLEQIERESHLKIVWAENEARVKIKPTPLTKETHYQEGCNAFIDLYQTVHQSMKRQVVDIEDIHDDEKIKESIAFVESKHPVVIEKVEGLLIVYSEEIHLKSSVKALKKMLGMSKIRGDNPRHGQRNIRHSSHHHEQPLPIITKILQQTLTNNVRLSLYQGDITDEQVHAIVNPANAWLQHSQGVGGAIVKKGGSQIMHESQYIMSHRNVPLQPGEAVYTGSGKMACHYIIHTVGPDWSAYADKSVAVTFLRVACINCLRLAVRLQLSSIAIPAISSGNCGMPKEVCAGAIFRAIDEFSTSIDAECSTLRDIRVVIIDTETAEVFRGEFINHYYSKQKTQNQMATQRGPSSEEGESSFSTNRGRGIDDELPNEKRKSTQDNFTGSMRRQHGDNSHQRVEEQHRHTFEESNLKAAEWTLADGVETQNVGSGMNVNTHTEEGRDTDERYEKTARSSVKSVPGRGVLAPSFSRKGDGVTKGASVEGVMSYKPTRPIKHPPGLSATEDGLDIAKKLMGGENNEQFTEACDVKNVNRPDPNKRNTNEEEGKPPDKSEDGNEREPSASGPVHSNSTAPKTIQMPLEITPDPTNASASGKVNAPNDVPLSAAGTTQGPGQNTRKEKEPGVSSREASPPERDEDQSQGSQATKRGDHSVESLCSVCHNSCQELVEPLKCGHTFCQSCFHHPSSDVFVCGNQWCVCERSQPIGTMSWGTEKQPLRGYDDCYTIAVTYNFPSGIQGWQHPAQGQPYRGRYFTAYLPNNSEGQKVCQLLKRAFDAQLLFTIGKYQVTGEENQIVCKDIAHKINRSGGPANHGYPDSTYLDQVKEQLAKIGIVDDANLQV